MTTSKTLVDSRWREKWH